MSLLFDSFWRAAAYCLHPRVILLSLLPLLLMAALALGLGYFFWEAALDAVRAAFESWSILATMIHWLEGIGLASLKAVLAPMVVVFLSTPVIVVLALLMVAAFMTPSMLGLVAARRFPLLERKHGGSFFGSALGALWATVVALVALLVSIPLWFVPPLVLVVPPLIWGWLTYRVMSYDVLAEHASADERRTLIRRHRVSAARHGRAHRLPRRGAVAGLGLGCDRDRVRAGAGAGRGLDLHAGVRVLGAVVRALRARRAAGAAARDRGRRDRAGRRRPARDRRDRRRACLELPPAEPDGAPPSSPWARS